MKALVVGLGSMGKRRVRNLRALGVTEIIGADIRADRCAEAHDLYGIRTFPGFEAGMESRPEIVLISTPPNAHLDYAIAAANSRAHVFTEFSWTEDLTELDRVSQACRINGVVGAPSCTQRFQESVRRMRELVQTESIGRPLFLLFHSGQWAPDWHPWEPITDFYLGHKHMGGGREQVSFELDWIRWVMGPIDNVSAMARKLTTLPADIDDLFQISVGFNGGAVGTVTVDMIQRAPNRLCVVMSEHGQFVWDYVAGVVRLFRATDKTWTTFEEPPGTSGYFSEGQTVDEPMYVNEIEAFLNAAEGRAPFPNTYDDERSLLAIVHAIEQSDREGRRMELGGNQ